MMTPNECADGWKRIVQIYEDSRAINNPNLTMHIILKEFGLPKTKEIFATVAKIKEHDGRIYGRNREEMNRTETNPEATVWERTNPMIRAGLDDIHTAHIDNLITELLEKERES